MSQETAVYDLGELDRGARAPQPGGASAWEGSAALRAPDAPLDWVGSLSLFLPGSPQILAGQFAPGLGFLSCMAFLAALSWAVLDSLDRLIATLGILGYPREFAVWTLAALYACACLLHLLGVLTRTEEIGPGQTRVAPHPAIPGVASLLVPGWGQILNGDRKRAAMFLFGVWAVAAAWILASTPARDLLEAQGFYLPRGLELFASSAVRWTLPAVIWTLAVYDATSRAAGRR